MQEALFTLYCGAPNACQGEHKRAGRGRSRSQLGSKNQVHIRNDQRKMCRHRFPPGPAGSSHITLQFTFRQKKVLKLARQWHWPPRAEPPLELELTIEGEQLGLAERSLLEPGRFELDLGLLVPSLALKQHATPYELSGLVAAPNG